MCSATSILPRQHVVAATADCGGGANESRNRNSSRGARLPKNRTKEIQAALSGIAGLWKQCLLLVALIPRAGGPEPTANHGPSEGRAGFTRSAENLVPRAHGPLNTPLPKAWPHLKSRRPSGTEDLNLTSRCLCRAYPHLSRQAEVSNLLYGSPGDSISAAALVN